LGFRIFNAVVKVERYFGIGAQAVTFHGGGQSGRSLVKLAPGGVFPCCGKGNIVANGVGNCFPSTGYV